MAPVLEMIRKYLPQIENICTQGRASDLKNKTADELRKLKDLGMHEISLGVESGDDWTLARINKGYTSADILEQCHKLEEAGMDYWMTFLNGVAGKAHSAQHAVNYIPWSQLILSKTTSKGGGELANCFPGTTHTILMEAPHEVAECVKSFMAKH